MVVAHDAQAGRLAVHGQRYATALVRRGPTTEGGLEPTRLFDALGRPLTVLLADGVAGPAPDLRIVAAGGVVADTQPGRDHGLPLVSALRVRGARVDRVGEYRSFSARGTTGSDGPRIVVSHRFEPQGIRTSYRVSGASDGERIVARLPVWGRSSTLVPVEGATSDWRRTNGPLRILAKTRDGASMEITYRGLPAHARLRVVRGRSLGRAPRGTRTLVISTTGQLRRLERDIVVLAPDTARRAART